MVVGFTIPITTCVASLNPVHSEVYSMQLYVIKFVSDLQKGSGFQLLTTFKVEVQFKKEEGRKVSESSPSRVYRGSIMTKSRQLSKREGSFSVGIWFIPLIKLTAMI